MIDLPSELIVNHVEEIYAQLNGLLESGSEVVINIGAVEKADTAGLQLLCSMQKSLQKVGQKIAWSGNSETLKSTAQLLGLDTYLGL